MKKVMTCISAALLLFSSCDKSGMVAPPNGSTVNTNPATVQSTAISGIRTAMPAFYDSMLLKIQFVEFSPQAEASHIAHDKSMNFIYQSDPGLPNNQRFISVIDAIPGDGFNPVWREVQIVFNQGFTPRQLFSDNEVLAAATGVHPEITLDTTNEVYWCPVIGQK